MRSAIARLVVIAAAVTLLDQWTKHWASTVLATRAPIHVIDGLVRLTYTRNSGVAFGIGAGVPFPYWSFSLLAIGVILWMFVRHRVHGLTRQIALALIMGGAIGNLIDRVRFGEVTDFILLSWRRWQFPVFNVADSAVTIGVALFALVWPHPVPDEQREHGADTATVTELRTGLAEPAPATQADDEPRAPSHGPGAA